MTQRFPYFAGAAMVALAALTPAAMAGPDRVSILLGAHHAGASGFEEFTPGLFLTWEERAEISVGAFSNSYGEASVAISAAVPVVTWEGGMAQIFGGAAYYDNAVEVSDWRIGDIVPLLGLQLRQGAVFSQIIPMDGDPVDALITFGVSVPIERVRR